MNNGIITSSCGCWLDLEINKPTGGKMFLCDKHRKNIIEDPYIKEFLQQHVDPNVKPEFIYGIPFINAEKFET